MLNILYSFKNYFTKENITFLIALLGFIVSLINFTYFFIIRKRKLSVCFGAYGIKKSINGDVAIIHYQFENKSQLPISITNIQIKIGEHKYNSDFRQYIAEEFEYKKSDKVVCHDITRTDIMPINLNSLAACSGFLGFLIPQDSLLENEKSLTFRICTNRGRAIQKTFVLYEDVLLR